MFDLFIIFAFTYILSVIVLSIGYAFIFGLITFWFEILIISLIVSIISTIYIIIKEVKIKWEKQK